MTVAQVRVALAGLLQTPPVPASKLASNITRQLRRNEEVRRARWRAKGLEPPLRWKSGDAQLAQ
jgi:hypothetical protein